jgi:hypothetical protein
MTKDEDDWLADFLEAAQATAKQSHVAAEKDYATKLKLMQPRFDRANTADADQELAKRLAASGALAGQRKFDAASDALDEAFLLAASLIATAVPTPPIAEDESAASSEGSETSEAAGEDPVSEEPTSMPDEAPAEDTDASFDAAFAEAAATEESAPGEAEGVSDVGPSDEAATDAPADEADTSLDDALAEMALTDEQVGGEEGATTDTPAEGSQEEQQP